MNGEDNYEHIMEVRRCRSEEADERHYQKTIDLMLDGEMCEEWLSKTDLAEATDIADELGDAIIADAASRNPAKLSLNYTYSAAHGAADYFENYYRASPRDGVDLACIISLMPEHYATWKSYYEFCSEVVGK